MRYGWIVFLLALLVAAVGARGSDIAQPMPASRECPVPADPTWTKAEQFVWQRVCIGEPANFNIGQKWGGNLDPKKGLPESRILRPRFLESILLADKYRHALTRRGVQIIGARFTETVDLENAELEHNLLLGWSLLEGGAN